ncbi:hypothetical protein Hte_002405 [Hypoxylon texense]
MADNMCGPSNAAKGLTRHLDQDHSLQRDRFTGPSGTQDLTQSFRNLRLNQNNEFSSFQNQNAALPGPLHHQPRNDLLQPTSDLLGTDPQVWARQFSNWRPSDPIYQPIAPMYNPRSGSMATTAAPAPATHNNGGQFSPFPAHATPQVPQMHHPGPYLGLSHTPLQGSVAPVPVIQPGAHLPDGLDVDFDFDNELRAWCTANGPETEDQVSDFLQRGAIHQEEQIQYEGLSFEQLKGQADAMRAAEMNQWVHDQKMAAIEAQESLRAKEQAEMLGAEDITSQTPPAEDSELVKAAQQILDAVSNNDSTKFQESSFIQMMRKIAAKDLVVRDNALVDASEASTTDAEPGKVTPKPATVEDAPSS